MLKLLFWLCMLILSLLTGFQFLGGGEMGRLGNTQMRQIGSPNFSTFEGEYAGEEKLTLLPPELFSHSSHQEIDSTSPFIEDSGSLNDLESDIDELKMIHSDEKYLLQQIVYWNNQFGEIENLHRESEKMVKMLEEKQIINENLRTKYQEKKKTREDEKLSFKQKHREQKMEKMKYLNGLVSITAKIEELDRKIKQLDDENENANSEKDQMTEAYEMKVIEMEKHSHRLEIVKLPHTIEDLKNEIKVLTKKRLDKELQIMRSMEENFEWLMRIPFVQNHKMKAKKLKSQMFKLQTQMKNLESKSQPEVSSMKMIEDHMSFLKTIYK